MSDGISWAYEQQEKVDNRRLDKYYTAYRVKYDDHVAWFNIKKVKTNLHPEDINEDSGINETTFLTKEEAVKFLKVRFQKQIEELNEALIKLEEDNK